MSEANNSETITKDKKVEEHKPKAPDGGWGWFVCFGSSLITLSLRSLDPSFGLIFNDLLTDLKVDSTKTSSVLSVLDACMNFSGIFVGPLLNKFSFRQVAICGSLLSCTGLVLTAYATSIAHILVTYSILTGVGTGLAVASAFVALNTYFDKKKGQAVGFSSAGTTIAMMLVPQAAHLFLGLYGFKGTMLIFGGLSMHSIIGSCFLRPLKPTKTISFKKQNLRSLDSNELKIHKERREVESLLVVKNGKNENNTEASEEILNEEKEKNQNEKKDRHSDLFVVFTDLFDLNLFKNYSYLNVICGLSLFNVAETNFKLMTPFFLRNSVGMTEGEVATCLSLTAFTDIVARIVLPIIYDKLGFKKRRLFWINAFFVAVGRSILAERSKGTWLYIILIINGFIRGAAIQNLLLSVSETCSLKSLPHAIGLFMVSKGCFSLALSPLVGFVRDYSGSYRICLHAMSGLIFICFISWSVEFLWIKLHEKRKPEKDVSSIS
ncbi:monocarboxylate transporter 1 [Chelonus insularis]|uniref:monocarboxylate transporter 1 n=1 Tax=Chelonus insularis TaxID=460826 RepID=UPI00158F56B2|nr:monocarboxylate transporter 1 [Chelonus insularis]